MINLIVYKISCEAENTYCRLIEICQSETSPPKYLTQKLLRFYEFPKEITTKIEEEIVANHPEQKFAVDQLKARATILEAHKVYLGKGK